MTLCWHEDGDKCVEVISQQCHILSSVSFDECKNGADLHFAIKLAVS